MKSLAVAVLLILATASIGFFVLREAGQGQFGEIVRAGSPTATAIPPTEVREREAKQAATTQHLDIFEPKQILFGDLHVHSSFSTDAFQLTLPMAGGEGVHPVSDACDFARFCAGLDFWSINDHANSITARRWKETVEAVRECNAISESTPGQDPDMVSFLGWEWTQMGSTPDNHYGHKNVILRDLEADKIPARPIAAAPPKGVPSAFNSGMNNPLLLGLGAFTMDGGHNMVRSITETLAMEQCPLGVPVRDLPLDCTEAVETPTELFAKLDEWGHAATVIPHGTTWGMYTPPGSDWAKQLTPALHDPNRQKLVEIYSGHGNAEEYRPWVAAEIAADGSRLCPAPSNGYLPACWQAGEIIRDRCLNDASESGGEGEGKDGQDEAECERRAASARQHFVDADRNGGAWTVPGLLAHELGAAGQCRDCFQPAFNYRPLGSVQQMLALGRPENPEGTRSFRFGFISSSDNHTARAGTGYKEVARREFTDTRMGEIGRSNLVTQHRRPPRAASDALEAGSGVPSVALLETERGGSFFLTGGLAAVHANGRTRGEVWDAFDRRETYGTSGPRILLWFDLLDPNAPGGAWPMGSEVQIGGAPTFRVRAAGSFEQNPGCPASTEDALTPERIASLCMDECYFPSDQRKPISRIEVVRIRTQQDRGEPVAPLIEDPWKTLPCLADGQGCEVVFSDPEFSRDARGTSYYVRAIETASPVIGADPIGCNVKPGAPLSDGQYAACAEIDPCLERPNSDECTAAGEQRAWSSPIFIDFAS
ncbi:MAG: DUF3604 domain-containing protein [Myxococcota bacterium]